MELSCQIAGCKATVPPPLETDAVCVLHFLVRLEQTCDAMRRETVFGDETHERYQEIIRYIAERGERLSRVATSGLRLPDELKARILTGFLILMNLRENLDRALSRSAGRKTGIKT
jgi:hypothetical protein